MTKIEIHKHCYGESIRVNEVIIETMVSGFTLSSLLEDLQCPLVEEDWDSCGKCGDENWIQTFELSEKWIEDSILKLLQQV